MGDEPPMSQQMQKRDDDLITEISATVNNRLEDHRREIIGLENQLTEKINENLRLLEDNKKLKMIVKDVLDKME